MKTLLITGAVGGIGLATAKHFALWGWRVGLYDIDQVAVAAALEDPALSHCFGAHCDVTETDSVSAMIEHFMQNSGGRMDALINNAGVLSSGEFADMADADCLRMININVLGLTRVAQAGFSALKTTPGSVLVNLCSVSSVHGIPTLAVYSASKFYVNGFTEALALEWRKHGIRVSCIKPPIVKTSMGEAAALGLGGSGDIPVLPEDVAGTIDRIVAGRGTGYFMDAQSRVWSLLDRWLWESAREWLAATLTGYHTLQRGK